MKLLVAFSFLALAIAQQQPQQQPGPGFGFPNFGFPNFGNPGFGAGNVNPAFGFNQPGIGVGFPNRQQEPSTLQGQENNPFVQFHPQNLLNPALNNDGSHLNPFGQPVQPNAGPAGYPNAGQAPHAGQPTAGQPIAGQVPQRQPEPQANPSNNPIRPVPNQQVPNNQPLNTQVPLNKDGPTNDLPSDFNQLPIDDVFTRPSK